MKKITNFLIIIIGIIGISTLTYAPWNTFWSPPSTEKVIRVEDTRGPSRVRSMKAVYNQGTNRFNLTWTQAYDSNYPGFSDWTKGLAAMPYYIYVNVNDWSDYLPKYAFPVSQYSYYTLLDTGNVPIKKLFILIDSTSNTSWQYTPSDGNKYYFMIRAMDAVGNLGDPSYSFDVNDYNTSDIYSTPLKIETLMGRIRPKGSRARLTWNVPLTSSAVDTPISPDYETSYSYNVLVRFGGTKNTPAGYDTTVVRGLAVKTWDTTVPEGGLTGIGKFEYLRKGIGSRVIADFFPDSVQLYDQGQLAIGIPSGKYWSFAIRGYRKNVSGIVTGGIPGAGSGMGNKIINGNFDGIAKNINQNLSYVYGWRVGNTGLQGAVSSLNPSNYISSRYSLNLANGGYATTNINIPITPGKRYYCSTMAFGPASSQTKFYQYDTNNVYLSDSSSSSYTLPGAWVPLPKVTSDGIITAHPSVDYIRVAIPGVSTGNTSYDNVQMFPVDFLNNPALKEYPTIVYIDDNTPPYKINNFLAKTTFGYDIDYIDVSWSRPRDIPYNYIDSTTIYLSLNIPFTEATDPVTIPTYRYYPKFRPQDTTYRILNLNPGSLYYVGVVARDKNLNLSPMSKVYDVIVGSPSDNVKPESAYLSQQPIFKKIDNKITLYWTNVNDYDDFGQFTKIVDKYYVYRRRENRVGNRLYDTLAGYLLGSFERRLQGWYLGTGTAYTTTAQRFYGTTSLLVLGTGEVYNSTNRWAYFDTSGLNGKYFETVRVSAHVYNNSPISTDRPKLSINAVAAGVRGYWTFNENGGSYIYDSSGNGINGQLQGSPTWTSGVRGVAGDYALRFNGNNYIGPISLLGSRDSYSFTSYTVEAWVQPTYINSETWHPIVSKNYDGSSVPISLCYCGTNYYGDGRRGFSTGFYLNSWGWVGVATGEVPEINKWYHVVGSFDYPSRTLRIYVNGQLKQSRVLSSGYYIPNNTQPTYMAVFYWSSSYRWNGDIDEVTVYNYALDAPTITRHYDNKRNGTVGMNISKIFTEVAPGVNWNTIALGAKLPFAGNWEARAGLASGNSSGGAANAASRIFYDNVSVDNGFPRLRATGAVGVFYDSIVPNPSGGQTFAQAPVDDTTKIMKNAIYYYGVRGQDEAIRPNGKNIGYTGVSQTSSGVEDYVFTDITPPRFDSSFIPRANYWRYADTTINKWWNNYIYNPYSYTWNNPKDIFGTTYIYDSVLLNGTTRTVYNYNTTRIGVWMENNYINFNSPASYAGAGYGVGNKYKWGDYINFEVRINKFEPERAKTVKAIFTAVDDSGEETGVYIDKDAQQNYRYRISHMITAEPDIDPNYPRPGNPPAFPNTRGYRVSVYAVDKAYNTSAYDTSFSVMLDNTPPSWRWLSGPKFVGDYTRAYWMFETTGAGNAVYDSSWSANPKVNGTLYSPATIEKESFYTKVLNLDRGANNGYVDFTTSENTYYPNGILAFNGINETGRKFTVEAWVNPYDTTGWDGLEQVIVGSWNNTSGSMPWKLALYGSQVRFYLKTIGQGSATFDAVLGAILVPKKWYHIVATYESSAVNPVNIYVRSINSYNSVNRTRASPRSIAAKNSNDKLIVGGSGDGTTSNFRGHIDEIYIHNGKALTNAEIIERFQEKGIWIKKYPKPRGKGKTGKGKK